MSSDKNQSVSQLPLDLSVEVSTGREDLIESPANEMAIALIDAWPDWPGRWWPDLQNGAAGAKLVP
ncbi:MAG: hypothetical protein AAFW66_08485, partial [Pseudomonadota bacterium]